MARVPGRLRRVLASVVVGVVVAGGPAEGARARPAPEPDAGIDAGISVAPNPAAGEVSAETLAALQRDLKVTAEQAQARLVRADWATRLDPLLRARLGSAVAGSWLAEDGHEFVVAITDRRHEKLVRASGATPKLVPRSEAELSAIGARLEVRAKDPAGVPDPVAGWVVDPQGNQVRVRFLPGGRAAAEAFVAAAGLTAGQVSYEAVVAKPAPVNEVEGGDKYVLSAGGVPSSGYCSVAFAVTINSAPGRSGYLTAGHCAGEPDVWVPSRIFGVPGYMRQGRFIASRLNSDHDEGVVQTNYPFFPRPAVNTYNKPPFRPEIAVSDGTPQVDGSPVCHSGATTLFNCGTIRPGVFNFPPIAGAAYRNLKATNTCALPGDSGGAVISGTHAQGIISSGFHIGETVTICPLPSQQHTFYVPVQRALSAMGVTLQTRMIPTPPSPPSPSQRWAGDNRFWDGLGGAVQGKVASVSLNPNHLQVFGRGTDNRLYTNASVDGGWGGWQGLGDLVTEPPTVLARSGGIDVYYRGGDTRPYLRRFNGSGWEAPVRLGDIDVVGPITALSPHPGHVILFIRSSDDEVYFNFTDGVAPWSGWLGLGGDTNAAPTAVARTNAAGQIVLEVYARWADDNVRYRRLDPAGPPGWQPWVNLGGIWKDTPVGVTVGPNQSWLIGWGSDNTAQVQRFKDGDWLRGAGGSITTGWRGLGGNVASSPAAIAGPGERIRILARDASQQINTISWLGGNVQNWERWSTLDGDTVVPVGASLRTDAQATVIDMFGVDAATQQPFHTVVDAALAVTVQTSDTTTSVGHSASFTVSGPPGAPITWSATQNGAVREDHVFYGHYTDANGEFTWYAGEWPGSAAGSWVKQAHVGTPEVGVQTAQVAFTVSPRPVTVQVDKDQYRIGENITYAVTGPPNRPIYWTSWVNGLQSGENHAFYGQHTDANGVFTVTAPWTDPRTGTWTKQVYIDDGQNGQIAEITFGIIGPPWPVTVRTDQTHYGFGDFITYAVTGPPNQPIHWTSWVDGTLVQDNVPNGSTDANGGFTTSAPWIGFRNGTHVVQVSIGGQTAQTTFVFDWPQPPPPPLLPGPMTAAGTGKCLDIAGASLADGARAQQNTCHEGANQQWRQSAAGGLIAEHSGKCLRPVGSAQGSVVQQVTCNALEPLQAWEVTAVTGISYLFRIVSVSTGLCLSVQDGSVADGASIYLWPCDTPPYVGQRWADPSPPPPPPGLPPGGLTRPE